MTVARRPKYHYQWSHSLPRRSIKGARIHQVSFYKSPERWRKRPLRIDREVRKWMLHKDWIPMISNSHAIERGQEYLWCTYLIRKTIGLTTSIWRGRRKQRWSTFFQTNFCLSQLRMDSPILRLLSQSLCFTVEIAGAYDLWRKSTLRMSAKVRMMPAIYCVQRQPRWLVTMKPLTNGATMGHMKTQMLAIFVSLVDWYPFTLKYLLPSLMFVFEYGISRMLRYQWIFNICIILIQLSLTSLYVFSNSRRQGL